MKHMTQSAFTSFKVLPLGFSAFEKSTVETFFRLAARRAPFWEVTERFEEASVVLLNGLTRQDVDALSRKLGAGQRVVIVGASDFASGWPVLPRPLRLTALLTCLGAFVSPVELVSQAALPVANPSGSADHSRLAAPASALVPTMPSGAPTALIPVPATAPVLTTLQPAPAITVNSVTGDSVAIGRFQAPVKPPLATPLQSVPLAGAAFRIGGAAIAPMPSVVPVPAAQVKVASVASRTIDVTALATSTGVAAVTSARNVLIVDDSDVALKFMQSRLRHFGYESLLARSGEEALNMTERQDFQFVFLDVMMAGLDGYQTCRAIKMNKGRRATVPVIVMLTSRGGTIDKIRGSMSGCDAYLTKPLNEQQLGMVLTQHSGVKIPAKAPVPSGSRLAAAIPAARSTQPGFQKQHG